MSRAKRPRYARQLPDFLATGLRLITFYCGPETRRGLENVSNALEDHGVTPGNSRVNSVMRALVTHVFQSCESDEEVAKLLAPLLRES